MDFSSDNSFGVHPDIMQAVVAANGGTAHSYGGDVLSSKVRQRFCEIFETEVEVFLVPTGTAGNAISISTFCPPIGSVFAHREAHTNLEECGAAEFYTGGAKIVPVGGFGGQIESDLLADALAADKVYGHRSMLPSVLSLTQATECGTVYKLDTIARLAEVAKSNHMAIHMDGARFANAVVSLGCAPAELTWRLGVDVMTFGATKNGAMSAEAVVLFDRSRADELDRRRLRGGHLWSKMRFLAAQFDAYLDNDLWIKLAGHANAMANNLSAGLSGLSGVRIAWPTESNEVFAILPDTMCAHLEGQGARFYSWNRSGLVGTSAEVGSGEDLRRMICSFETTPQMVDDFLTAARGFNG